jgi:hypothetical protein
MKLIKRMVKRSKLKRKLGNRNDQNYEFKILKSLI